MKKIAFFVDGQIAHDSRVCRLVNSLSSGFDIDLFYINGQKSDSLLFQREVNLFSGSITTNWIVRNILFHKSFSSLKHLFLKRDVEYEYIYCNDYPLLHLCYTLSKRHNTKLIYDSHEIYIATINQFFPEKGWKKLYGIPLILLNKFIHYRKESRLIRDVDLVITVCDSFKNYFENEYNLKNVLVLKNGPSISMLPTTRADKFDELRETDIPLILYQGNLNRGRGLENLIRAFGYLRGKMKLIILGNGMIKSKLLEIQKNNNIDNVYFHKAVPQKELLEYTSSADAGIMIINPINISKKLTLPNKAFEYMAAGIPIISNKLPEVKNLIQENNCGYVINDKDPETIASELLALDLSNNITEQLGDNGKNAIMEKYNWETEVQKLLKLLKK